MYDEEFHQGVNIIHGSNGSGKSTIADFIFFALGGELTQWRKEAMLADYVLAEVTTSEATLTLRRDVSSDAGRPMHIYFGSYDAAVKADMREWERFPYKRSASQFSFSQILFQAMCIPEAVGAGESNITMHQLLRVLYSDQLTPIQRIFRVEPFDPWEVRQAVGDLLCGLGGYNLHSSRLELRAKKKEFEDVNRSYKSLIVVAASLGDDVSLENIDVAKRNAEAKRSELYSTMERLLSSPEDPSVEKEEAALDKANKRKLTAARKDVADLAERLDTLNYEHADGIQFIGYLNQAIDEFSDAARAFTALGAVRFEFCPACFAPVNQEHSHEANDTSCQLCGSAAVPERDGSRTLAVKLDLQMQLRESIELQAAREALISETSVELATAKRKLNRLEKDNVTTRSAAASRFETLLADVSQRIGYIDAEIEQLGRREQLAQELRELGRTRALIQEAISVLDDEIEAGEAAQKKRKALAYEEIERLGMALLKQDHSDHSDFDDVTSLTFDFSGDWIALNGNKNRVGSASGMVILKNSFLLALFQASLIDEKFFLPRFMLMDNVEDKGMVAERSWNFQRLILAASKAGELTHQFIFTTSKIAPELDQSPYVVGGAYSKARRTLNIA
ncbi:AAA family ATPase [Stenotrophomonas sp.]|uniref:AAA family ATPase n=1 Tax=Stenotrophomonas sp. TaxID=69392 RepID=UPI0028B2071C|nr:AAA family ATPase [Stenotrophomonas sp.]